VNRKGGNVKGVENQVEQRWRWWQYAPIVVTGLYAIGGSIWISFTDEAIARWVHGAGKFSILEIGKGWMYILGTAVLMYVLIHYFVSRLTSASEKIELQNIELRKVNRALKALSETNELLVRSSDSEFLLQQICGKIVDACEYKLAWVGLAEDDEAKTVVPVAQAGFEDGFLQTINVTWADTERGRGPTGTAIRTGKPSVIRNIAVDPAYAPWREEALKRGYASSAAFPLKAGEKVLGAVNIYASEPDAFDEAEIGLLSELADDLAYGMTQHQLRADHGKALEALKASERKYRLVAENVTDVIWTTDLSFKYTYISPSVERLRGYTAEESIKQRFEDILTPDSWKTAKETLAEAFAPENKGSIKSRTLRLDMKHKNGSIVPTEVTANIQRDENGRVIGLLGVTRNITERVKAEVEKEQLQEKFLQSQKLEAVGRLAGGIAHDFNNLLTVIQGNTQMLLASETGKNKPCEKLTTIAQAAGKASDLVKQLLVFSRRQVVQPAVVNVNKAISDITRMFTQVIGEDIVLITTFGQDVRNVLVDPSQLHQVVMNLAVNARDAMPHGGRLTIETANVELAEGHPGRIGGAKPGPYVMIAMTDTGVGMDAATLGQLFEPFFTTKEQGKGTGLGLSTTYGIVKQSGGQIQVESEPGKGSTFRIYLPACDRAPKEEMPQVQDTPVQLQCGKGIVLIVEDDKDVRSFAMEVLESCGYKVVTAPNGAEALKVCRKLGEILDLVLTDVVMPEMSGRALVKELSELFPNLKTVYMSGYTDDAIIRHGVETLTAPFLEKPFTAEALARIVRETLYSSKGP
jgi:PAS domain S-box-containing protein